MSDEAKGSQSETKSLPREGESDEEDDEEVGPSLPAAASTKRNAKEDKAPAEKKRRKVVLNAKRYFNNLPQLERYARSFMHRDSLVSVTISPITAFLITASQDGFVKFWKKQVSGIDFVKQYRAHTGSITSTAVAQNGELYATACATEKSIKGFDVVNFDLFIMLQLDYTPRAMCWIASLLAVSDAEGPTIRIYDLKADTEPIHTITNIHAQPVILMSYNTHYHCMVSCDEAGNIEYWRPEGDYSKPQDVFKMKSATDLYEFRKTKSLPTCLTISPDGESFATMSFPDRELRIFRFKTGKITRKYDESLAALEEMHHSGKSMVKLDDIEFGKRLGIERELEKDSLALQGMNVIFDESGLFLLYPTMLGVKVVNTNSNACVKIYGRDEKLRLSNISLYQGAPQKAKATTLAMAASDNPLLAESLLRDPILFCTAFRKSRFYLFSSRELPESKIDRDALNERPTIEDSAQADQHVKTLRQSGTAATLHTSQGDIKIQLFPSMTPKTVENFVTHAKNGYYDTTIFHRTIKQFMIQGGDPLGTGTGGTSIWNSPFEDEFHRDLRHEKYSLSMANSGPNSNGSQFFITTESTPHLDGKHTVFGRVVAGFDVVHHIENAPVGKLDRPRDPVHIHSIKIDS